VMSVIGSRDRHSGRTARRGSAQRSLSAESRIRPG
jgi:hypothetical protein